MKKILVLVLGLTLLASTAHSAILYPTRATAGSGASGDTYYLYTTNFFLFNTNIYYNDTYVSNYFNTNVINDIVVSNAFFTNFYSTNILETNLTITNWWGTNWFVSNYFTTNIFGGTLCTSNYWVTNYEMYVGTVFAADTEGAVSPFFQTNLYLNEYASNFFYTNYLITPYTTNYTITNYYGVDPAMVDFFDTNVWAGNASLTDYIKDFLSTNTFAATAMPGSNAIVNVPCVPEYVSNYFTTNFYTNTYITITTNYWTNTYVDYFTITNGLTNLSLTANTVLKADANKRIASITNRTGVLTNNGSGVFDYVPIQTLLENSYFTNMTVTNLTVVNGFTNKDLLSNALVKTDTNKRLTSITNATGVLTNDGSGSFAYVPIETLIENSFFTNITVTNLTIISNITAKSITITNNNIYITNVTVVGSLTNLDLSPSQYVQTDANRKLVSTLDGQYWTNIPQTLLNLYGSDFSITTNGNIYTLNLTNGTSETTQNQWPLSSITNANNLTNWALLDTNTFTPSYTTNYTDKYVAKAFKVYTNLWDGPTNYVNMTNQWQKYVAYTPCSITGLLNRAIGGKAVDNVLITITNASSTNITWYYEGAIRTGDGARSWTITNACEGKLSLEYSPNDSTNAVFRMFY